MQMHTVGGGRVRRSAGCAGFWKYKCRNCRRISEISGLAGCAGGGIPRILENQVSEL